MFLHGREVIIDALENRGAEEKIASSLQQARDSLLACARMADEAGLPEFHYYSIALVSDTDDLMARLQEFTP